MNRTTWLGGVAVASLLLTGCATASADAPQPESSHTMPDGTVMPGSEHEGHAEHGEHEADGAEGPSAAAEMICSGQVVRAVTSIFALEADPAPSSAWESPMFTCTYEVDGAPLVLSVHDATDVSAGETHFAKLQGSFEGAEEIGGLESLGLPSFADGEGVVGFIRDGKTLLVDTTALPTELGAEGGRNRHEAAYAVASAVLVCWVEHD